MCKNEKGAKKIKTNENQEQRIHTIYCKRRQNQIAN